MTELLIATGNQGKIAEIVELLINTSFDAKGLKDVADIIEVEETGNTFAENAILKASGYALQTGMLTLADDSGLAVDALGGRPGVYSARYGGGDTIYPEKIDLLLAEIAASGDENRRARFVCSMALANERGEILHISEGVCEGNITFAPSGKGGFGYDPIFIPEGQAATFGELNSAVKQQISHRARAISGIIAFLLDFKRV